MSLIAWYPLNGDLKNYGLGDMELTVSSTPTFSDGKIGKGLSNGGNATWTAEQTAKILNDNELSICFWVKVLNTGDRTNLFGNNNMTPPNNRKFSLMQYPNANDLHWSWQNGENTTFVSGYLTGVLPTGKWTHVAVTYKNPKIIIYINGVEARITNGVSNSRNFAYQTQVLHSCNSRIVNDYRFYDHCLSPKEVMEISKAKILHFPMCDIDGKIGGRNLILNGSGREKKGLFKNFTGIDTDGYCYHTLTSQKTYVSVNMADGFLKKCRDYTVGSKVCFSYDIMYTKWDFPEGTNRAEFWFGQRYTNRADGASATGAWKTVTFHSLPVVGSNGCKLNEWFHVEKILTIPEQSADVVRDENKVQFYNSNPDIAASFTFKMRNVKITESTYYFPWTPAPEDYPLMYPNVIYDTSGYCNNGTVTDASCPTWSDDRVIGNGSYKFDGSSKYIACGRNVMVTDEITVSWFGYMDNWANYTRAISCTENGGWNFEPNSGKMNFLVYSSGAYRKAISTVSLSSLSSGWHMFTATYNGLSVRLYIDGVLDASSSIFSTKSPITYNSTNGIFVGAEAGGNTTTAAGSYFNGNIQDVRIYATALSDSDIAELYSVRQSITDSGAVMTIGEFIEDEDDNVLDFDSYGLVKAKSLDEQNTKNMEIKSMPDGSIWGRIFYQNLDFDGNGLFASDDEVLECTETNKWSRLKYLENYRAKDGKFEFMLCYPDNTASYNRWKQTANPTTTLESDTSKFADGYEAISIAWSLYGWRGLLKSSTNRWTFIDGCGIGNSNIGDYSNVDWFYTIGAKALMKTTSSIGIAGYNYNLVDGEVELWVRLDTVDNLSDGIVKVYNDLTIEADEFIEI